MIAGERLETYETERMRADGARIAVSLTISQIKLPQRGIVGASVIARDITSETRRRKAQDFMLAASRLLDSSLDPDQTARTIVATAVPELAELCLIDFLRPDGWFGDSVVAGVDPEAASRLERIRRETPLDPQGQHPVAQVLQAGKPMVWRDLKGPEVIEEVAQNDEHRQLIDDAGYNSAAVVPLIARGRVVGALSFLHVQADLRYDPGDLDFLSELGDRAALVLDNARLYRERDEIAQSLQRGLRPPRPAEVLGLEISVVFEAAGRGIEIGGDLYDVLPTEDGCWILIGDVAGKGSAAAGVSVAVRHAVRGLTREIDEPRGGADAGQRAAAERRQPQRLRHRRARSSAPRRRGLGPGAGERRPPAGRPHHTRGSAATRWRLRARRLGGRRGRSATKRRSGRATRSCSAPTAGSRPARSPCTAMPRCWRRWPTRSPTCRWRN